VLVLREAQSTRLWNLVSRLKLPYARGDFCNTEITYKIGSRGRVVARETATERTEIFETSSSYIKLGHRRCTPAFFPRNRKWICKLAMS